ncbi:TonB-dependent receptor [Gilvimarinus sp. SDUM040013]|uniref:TonB-dependent receptor n=1 Tax=Gilvimarinus gilvus TaxID=3058038 RepID=A0ABU4RWQ5_9GAMM|nr:TonB-dependent receptor [Gilvimarinus sp. SDUM040013]MDO3385678.1 TonB-dependent receptor [Gilvimarinus sp. SDUM040013]MDX6849316.1 TonB-dependent receptor [Gilvimarinus sp. SDUM040013]
MLQKKSKRTSARFSLRRTLGVIAGVSPVILACSAAPTWASQSVIEEVLVTAQKREQSIQDTSVTVSAFSGEAMEKMGFEEGLDITQQVPNMNFFAIFGEASSPSISLRGISLVNYSDSWEAPVAMYVDDVYRGNPAGSAIQLFDLERVEVLRGPQGTLYGRNATGGLVNYISRDPTDEFEASTSLQIGSYSERIFEGMVSGPFSDSVRGRLAVKVNQADGWQNNNADPVNDYGYDVNLDQKLNETDSLGYRAKLAIDVGSDGELLLDVHGSEADQASVGFAHMGYQETPGGATCSIARIHRGECTSATFLTTGIEQAGGDFNPEDVSSSVSGGLDTRIDTFGVSATFNWTFANDMILTSITAMETLDKYLQDDGDGVGSGPAFDVFFDEQYTSDSDQLTQEFRLSQDTDQSSWVAGLYLYDDERDMSTQNPTEVEFEAADEFAFAHREDVLLDTQSMGVFGQYDWHFSDTMTLVLGARYTDENRDFSYERYRSYYNSPTTDTPTFVDDSISEDNFSGRIGLDWKPSNDTLVYTSLATGFRSGGFSASYNSVPEAFEPVGSEDMTNFEVGLKTTFAGGRMRFNGAVFAYELEGFQAQLFDTLANGGRILNAGDITGHGLEAELTAQVTENFEVIAGAGYLSTEMESDQSSPVAGDTYYYDGNELPSAPELSFNTVLRYYIPMGDTGELALQADYSWQDEHFLQVENDPYSHHDSYGIANAKVSWTSLDGRYTVDAFVNNVLEEEYFTYQNTLGSDWGYAVWGRPRTMGLKFSWKL